MKTIYDITKDILSDIDDLTVEFYDYYNSKSLKKYFFERDENFSSRWPNLITPYLPEKRIVYHIGNIAKYIYDNKKLNWMTFIIQNPWDIDRPFRSHNFGVVNEERINFHNWIENPDTFSFTRLFFLENLDPKAYSKLFCVKIKRKYNSKEMSEDIDSLNLINVMIELSGNNNEYAEIVNIMNEDKDVIYNLYENVDKIRDIYLGNNRRYQKYLAEYIKNMGKFTRLDQGFNYLYGIPVLGSFLPGINPTRSGLYLVSEKAIEPTLLQDIQAIITMPLSHIDYIRFQRIAEQEEQKRKKDVSNLVRLLSDFQHIMLKSTLGALHLLTKKENSHDLKISSEKMFDYFDRRRPFTSKLADYLTEKNKIDKIKRKYIFEDIKNTYLFANLPYFNNNQRSIEDIKKYWEETIQIIGVGFFEAYQGVVDCILENIIFNSITKGFECGGDFKIYIYLSNNYFIIWDTGVGFLTDDYKSIGRWINEGPNDEEKLVKKGFGYWLIKKCVDYNEGDFKYIVFSKDNSIIYQDEFFSNLINDFVINNLKTENLGIDRSRVIHFFFNSK